MAHSKTVSFASIIRWVLFFVTATAMFLLFFGGYFQSELAFTLRGPNPVEVVVPEQRGEPNSITIPVIGVHAPIIYVDAVDTSVFSEALHRGVVHYPGTAPAGQKGNAYFFGHSSDVPGVVDPYRNVFALLPHLKLGDRITVTDEVGKQFTYVVVDTFVVTPNDLSVLDQGDGSRSLLTLQTSYPLGTAIARFIVVSELEGL